MRVDYHSPNQSTSKFALYLANYLVYVVDNRFFSCNQTTTTTKMIKVNMHMHILERLCVCNYKMLVL